MIKLKSGAKNLEQSKSMMARFTVSVTCAFLSACAPDAARNIPTSVIGPNVSVVNDLMTAFNNHDASAMRELWTDDVVWLEVSANEITIVTSSAEQLYSETVNYFKTYPSVRSSLENIAVNGNYVSAIERPVWEQDGERKSQASVVVYEVNDGKVRRFWYYPPQK